MFAPRRIVPSSPCGASVPKTKRRLRLLAGNVASETTTPFGIAARLTALLLVLIALLGIATSVATVDPHGLSGAPQLSAGDFSRLEPLYGLAMTGEETLDWHPDGSRIASGGWYFSGVYVTDARTGQFLLNLPVDGFVNDVRWSPNGRWIAVAADRGFLDGPGWVHLFDTVGNRIRSWEAHSRSIGGLDWSPDGSRIATVAVGAYSVWDRETGTAIYRVEPAEAQGLSIGWSPDGESIAPGRSGNPFIYDAGTGRLQVSTTLVGDLGAVRLAWSHRGDRVAEGTLGGCALVYTSAGELRWREHYSTDSCQTPHARGVTWSPDDSVLALASSQGVLLIDSSSGRLLRSLAFPVERFAPSRLAGNYGAGESEDIDVAWSPKGESIAATGAFSSPSLRLWGIRRSTVAIWTVAFETAILLGLPLAIGREIVPIPRTSEGGGPRAESFIASSGVGFPLFFCAFLMTVLQTISQGLLHRTYDGFVVPPRTWVILSGVVTLLFAAFATVAGVAAFRLAMWPNEPGRLSLPAVSGILGRAAMPILWSVALALAVSVLVVAIGLSPSASLASGLIVASVAAALIISAPGLSALAKVSPRRLLIGLLTSALTSITAFIFIGYAVVFVLNALQVEPPTLVAEYGISIGLMFGLVPFVSAIASLIVAGAVAVLLSEARFLGPLYSRLTRSEVIELASRRRVLAYLEAHPGSYFREMLRALPIGSGALHYHLSVLEREGLVRARREGMYLRFFLAERRPGR